MLLSPLLSYVSFGILGLRPIDFYFKLFTILFGFVFVLVKKSSIKIPKFIMFALIWALYYYSWQIASDVFSRWGLLIIFADSTYLAVFFILVIVYNTRFSNKFAKNAISIFILTAIISGVVSVMQVFDGNFFNARPLWIKDVSLGLENIYTNRRSSIFGFIDQNALGLSFMPLLSVLIGYLLLNKSKLYYIILATGGFVAFLSNTRYVMISFILITIQILAFNKVRVLSIIKYLTIGIVLLYAGYNAFLQLGFDMQDWSEQRIFREENARYASVLVFLEFFSQDFLVGNGDPRNETIRYFSTTLGTPFIHIAYLEMLVGYGAIGCFFLFGFWFLLIKRLYKTAKTTNYWGAFFAFLVFYFSMFTMTQTSIFYYGLIFALVFDKYYNDKKLLDKYS
jgi:hypothetical protein